MRQFPVEQVAADCRGTDAGHGNQYGERPPIRFLRSRLRMSPTALGRVPWHN